MERPRQEGTRRLFRVLLLTSSYMVVEAVGGWMTNSLALLADAGHMLTDVAALALALGAMWMCERSAPPEKTYGYYRLEILAALLNAVILLVISLAIVYEAYERVRQPPLVRGREMMVIALGGLVVNGISVVLLHRARHHSLNIRGAFLHVVSDGLGSIGALLAGGLIWGKGWYLADPVISFLTAGLIIVCAWRLLKEAVNILMEATPAHIDIAGVERAIRSVPGVHDVHDLHVWTITSGKDALSVHVIVRDDHVSAKDVLRGIRTQLREAYGIEHVTIQIETPDFEEEEIHF
jgi:cobalt-zinc-cadmium efflux system protein